MATTDQAAMEEYRKQVPATLARYGGRFVVRGGACQTVEGEGKPTRLAVIGFPSPAGPHPWHGPEGDPPPPAPGDRVPAPGRRQALVRLRGVSRAQGPAHPRGADQHDHGGGRRLEPPC